MKHPYARSTVCSIKQISSDENVQRILQNVAK